MGKRGPKPKPRKILQLENSQKEKRLPPEPPMEAGLPDPPKELDAAARKKWNEYAPELHRLGILTLNNRDALGIFCQAAADAWALRKKIRAEGWTAETSNGNPVQNPTAVAYDKAVNRMLRYGVEFGLTPSSRGRLSVSIQEQQDPLTAFVGKKKKA